MIPAIFIETYSCEREPYNADAMSNKIINVTFCSDSIDSRLKDYRTKNLKMFSSKYRFLVESHFFQ